MSDDTKPVPSEPGFTVYHNRKYVFGATVPGTKLTLLGLSFAPSYWRVKCKCGHERVAQGRQQTCGRNECHYKAQVRRKNKEKKKLLTQQLPEKPADGALRIGPQGQQQLFYKDAWYSFIQLGVKTGVHGDTIRYRMKQGLTFQQALEWKRKARTGKPDPSHKQREQRVKAIMAEKPIPTPTPAAPKEGDLHPEPPLRYFWMGKWQLISVLAKQHQLDIATLRTRLLRLKMSLEEALTHPKGMTRPYKSELKLAGLRNQKPRVTLIETKPLTPTPDLTPAQLEQAKQDMKAEFETSRKLLPVEQPAKLSVGEQQRIYYEKHAAEAATNEAAPEDQPILAANPKALAPEGPKRFPCMTCDTFVGGQNQLCPACKPKKLTLEQQIQAAMPERTRPYDKAELVSFLQDQLTQQQEAHRARLVERNIVWLRGLGYTI